MPSKPLPPTILTAVDRAILTQGAQVGWRSAPINRVALDKIIAPVRTFSGQSPAAHPLAAAHLGPASPLAAHAPTPFAGRPFNTAMASASQADLNETVQTRSVTQTLGKPMATAVTPKVPAGLLDRLNRLPQGFFRSGMVVPPIPIVAQPVRSQPITSSSLELTMQMMRVNIVREWLNPLLFHLGNWSLEGIAAGGISSGDVASNEGFFPLLPISLLVVRNVSISGTWSAEDKAFATQASTPGTAVAFGPLTLATGGSTQSTFDGATLTVPGMQVVAWYCSPVPRLPPA